MPWTLTLPTLPSLYCGYFDVVMLHRKFSIYLNVPSSVFMVSFFYQWAVTEVATAPPKGSPFFFFFQKKDQRVLWQKSHRTVQQKAFSDRKFLVSESKLKQGLYWCWPFIRPFFSNYFIVLSAVWLDLDTTNITLGLHTRATYTWHDKTVKSGAVVRISDRATTLLLETSRVAFTLTFEVM